MRIVFSVIFWGEGAYAEFVCGRVGRGTRPTSAEAG
jgi:hypothetical protein